MATNLQWTNTWYDSNGFTLYKDYGNDTKMWRQDSDHSYFVLCGYPNSWNQYRSVNGSAWASWNSGYTGAIKSVTGQKFRYLQEFDPKILKPAGFSIVDVTYANFFPTVEKGWDGGTLNVTCSGGTKVSTFNVTGNHNHTDHHHAFRVQCLAYMKRRYSGENIRLRIDAEGNYNYANMNTLDKGYAHTNLYPYDGAGKNHHGTNDHAGPWPSGILYRYDDYQPYFEIGMHARNNYQPSVDYSLPDSAWVGDNVLVSNVSVTDRDGDVVTLSWSGLSNYTGTLKTDKTNSTIQFTKQGYYELQLKGEDPFDAVGYKTRAIRIKDKYYPTVLLKLISKATTAMASKTKSIDLVANVALTNYNSGGKKIESCSLIYYECAHNWVPSTGESHIPDTVAKYTKRHVVTLSASEVMNSSHTFSTVFDARVYKQYYQTTLRIKYTDKSTTDEFYSLSYVSVTNTTPNAPTIVGPKVNSKLYLKKPPLVITTGTDAEKDNVYVTCDIVDHENGAPRVIFANHSLDAGAADNFSSTGYVSGVIASNIKIVPDSIPAAGIINAYVAMRDITTTQSEISSTTYEIIEKDNINYYRNHIDVLSTSHLNHVINMINANCSAYGLVGTPIAKYGDEIDYSSIMTIVNAYNKFCDAVNKQGNVSINTDLKKIVLSIDIGYDEIIPILNKIIDALYV